MKIMNRLSIGIHSAIVLAAASPSARAQNNAPTSYKFDFSTAALESALDTNFADEFLFGRIRLRL